MKVLVISNYAPAVHQVRPEAEMIIGLKERGVDMEVMTPASCWYAKRMEDHGIHIYDCLPRGKFDRQAIRFIRRALKDGRHDILHAFNSPAIATGIWASMGLPVKVVTYRGQTGNVSRYNPGWYLTHLSPRVDKIICVADAVHQDLLRHVFDPDKPITVYKGHDLAWYEGAQPVNLEDYGVPSDAFVVGVVANQRPRKGLSVLIESARFLPVDANIRFLLIGRGTDSEDVAKRIAATPAPEKFHTFGIRDDVLSFVASCDATVLPALRREGLPKTVIESMALGVAPIVTATGGSAELIVDGESGLVVPSGDAGAIAKAIETLYEDRERTAEMGRLAKQRLATHFRLEDSIEQTLAVYRSVLQ